MLLVGFIKRLDRVVTHLLKILEASFQYFNHIFAGRLNIQMYPLLCGMWHGVTAYLHARTAREIGRIKIEYPTIKLCS